MLSLSINSVNIELNSEQRARLELIALSAGKPAAEMLLEAAQLLLDRDGGFPKEPRQVETQKFLSEDQMEARMDRILRHSH
jgi:hypothetical protein